MRRLTSVVQAEKGESCASRWNTLCLSREPQRSCQKPHVSGQLSWWMTLAEWPAAHLAVERQKLEALEDAHERLGPGSLEVDILVAADAELPAFAVLLDKAMYMSDQRHEGDVGPNGEEDRVVDVVRAVRHPAARRRSRQRYELLLESLDGAVDLVYDIPKIPHEADQGRRVWPA